MGECVDVQVCMDVCVCVCVCMCDVCDDVVEAHATEYIEPERY